MGAHDLSNPYAQLIEHSADGMLVVDDSGTILLANRATEALLGMDRRQLLGQPFGRPVLDGPKTEIEVLGPQGPVVSEMHASGVDWDGRHAWLINLRDVTERRRSELLSRAVLNAIPSLVAVVEHDGTIVAVNEAWNRAARLRGASPDEVGVGQNYFDHCGAAVGSTDTHAMEAVGGIRSVLDGESDSFEFEYPCHDARGEQWFLMRVTRLDESPQPIAVVKHIDVTAQRAADRSQAFEEAEMALMAREAAERTTMTERAARTHATGEAFGRLPLEEADPEGFRQLSAQYARMLDEALERRLFHPGAIDEGATRELADALAARMAGPRDAVRLHLAALESRLSGATPPKAAAYNAEARLALVELLGHLVAHYRAYAVGSARGNRRGGSKIGETDG